MTDARAGRDEFVRRYGGIYEHSPWVAEETWDRNAELDEDRVAGLFAACVNGASRDKRLALIRAHPDLAGKAAVAGELTADSTEEQRRARLDQCTEAEFALFQSLNRKYRQKFGFPFVMAVRNSSRQEILEAFAARLDNDPGVEFDKAIEEIHKIASLRLESL